MEKESEQSACGCLIEGDCFGILSITYCPLHKAAPAMYKALEAWSELWEMRPLDSGCDMQDILKKCWSKTEKALAQAEGR